MGYTFTFGDIEKICHSLKMEPAKKGSLIWRGLGPDGKFRMTRIDSHRSGKALATGTAKRVAVQLGFNTVEEMHQYLRNL